MRKLPTLTESIIRQGATGDSFRKGQQYYQGGAVSDLALRGTLFQAQVQGSEYEPYQVRVTLDDTGVKAASCTCPYDWGGWCKHIVAALLAYTHERETIEERPELAELLARLNREQLQALLLRLAERDFDVAGLIEMEVALIEPPAVAAQSAAPPPAKKQVVAIDPGPIRRQMRAILRPAGYGYAGRAVEQVEQMLERVRQLTRHGEGHNALAMLEAITDEYTQRWFDIDDSSGELGAFYEELALEWAEALLSVELTRSERRAWAKKLAGWQREAEEYGAGEELALAGAAAEQGWDDPAIRRILDGAATTDELERDDWPDHADALVQIRLDILERQGRREEYLRWASATRQVAQHAAMLARMGRLQEAVAQGRQNFTYADEALALAGALREQGAVDLAVEMAEHGLALSEPRSPLAAWLADFAAELGKDDLALRAAETAFRSAPSLSAYLKARDLAGKRWAALQPALLDHLRATRSPWGYSTAQVDIFLHEGLIDDAIEVVKDGAHYTLLERVMDAAIKQRPDWVIEAATGQAERIMDAGQSQSYDYAVGWLERARDAYQVAGRRQDWQGYLSAVRAKHGRKYKLMSLIERL
jgi:uncharacterized Zn finger protein